MGDSTIDVRTFYEDEDLEIIIKDAPDHIAMELEFMYYLVAKQIQATNEGNLQDILLYQQKQKTFLYSHLARWLPEFTENVQKNAQTEFYKKLAQLTEMFVKEDSGVCALFDTRHPSPTGGG
jgi:TorA maturation chaperone TorD